ncbi:MAG TPA: M23 family metallopeptidase [Candidatus Fournierella excrementavium]|nr:M23 family metallopeptidase [Candidatus Fournierella excrementavium]
MWEKAQEIQYPPILPQAGEMKAALTPPLTPKEKQRPNYILRVQVLLCLLATAAVLAMSRVAPEAYRQCGNAFRAAMDSGVELNGQEQLLKFTSETVSGLQAGALEVMARLEQVTGAHQPDDEQAPELTGAGGQLASFWPFVPEGNSTKSYQPPFELALPLESFYITSDYGWRKHPVTGKSDFHTGVDLAAAEGTPIRPAAGGVVQKSEYSDSYGNNVVILHSNGVTTRYCHMQYVFVRQGETVDESTVLGTVGQTGMVTGPHLHFELLCDGVRYDPDKALGLT